MKRKQKRTNPFKQPFFLGVVLTALFTCTRTMSQQNPTDEKIAPIARDGQHDFDFIFGRWKVHLKQHAPGVNTWSEFDGTSVYRKVWAGRANLNEFEAESPAGHIEGLTLRTYNPKTRQWSLYWASSKDGILAAPQIGQFKDGRGEFYAEDTSDGKATFVRYVWTKAGADSVHFEQSLSDDGGQTWDTNWISDMDRLPDDAEKTVVTADTKSPAKEANALNDGQHDFQPLIGSWNYHLKRLKGPLTGSTAWIDLEGTGVCYPLWNGRAQLDTFEADGSTGHIEGLTLRLFNPRSHQWRLYWANSRDGAIAVPQVGQFKNGHGEFYAQDDLDGKSILVRFDWTKLETDSPHFEQSFSDDGGKTWEANWITDQTRSCDAPSKQQ
jgi:hypothetical protein